MRLQISAIGRLRNGPETALIDDYLQRFDRMGRSHGLGPVKLQEMDAKKGGGQAEEADLLLRSLPAGGVVVALDERGQRLSSPDLAKRIGKWRDDGCSDLSFVIGGADGLTEEMRARADFQLSFGAMVWPHALARVMLSEQLYRAVSILAGTPYHRS